MLQRMRFGGERLKRSVTRPDGIAARRRAPKRILLVGGPELAGLGKAALDAGYATTLAATARDAFVLANMDPAFDLCLLDVSSSALSGFDLARTLRTLPEFARTLVVFVVPEDAPPDLLDGILASGAQYVPRPIPPEFFAETLSDLLALRE